MNGGNRTHMSVSRRRLVQTGGMLAFGSFLTPTMPKLMEEKLFNPAGDLQIVASKTSSRNDFDFWMGKWRVHNKKLKTRLNDCKEWQEFEATGEAFKILGGAGNFDQYHATFEGVPFEGMTLRLFDPKTRLWSIYWADSKVVVLDVPVVGSFDGEIGRFYAKDVWEGKRIIMQFQWDKTDPDRPLWSQAFSADSGKTWEWNWYMSFVRQA